MALAQLPRHKGPMNTGLHWACWAPSKCPQPAHGWRQGTLQLKFLHVNFVKSLLELKIICLRARGKKNPFFFTSCGIMNSPFQGMCEFLLGLSECCKIFAVSVSQFSDKWLSVCLFPSAPCLPVICGNWFYLGRSCWGQLAYLQQL